mmetsp:Transcript_10986/g.13300  ORF Transcript_10986/g.13300 Transcript_10986/m.13300 type:complete len:114 (+) Transcript_10986:1682-2023(+)
MKLNVESFHNVVNVLKELTTPKVLKPSTLLLPSLDDDHHHSPEAGLCILLLTKSSDKILKTVYLFLLSEGKSVVCERLRFAIRQKESQHSRLQHARYLSLTSPPVINLQSDAQ